MADNYLERKMEEHRQGVRTAASRTSPALRPGLHLSYGSMRVAVICIHAEDARHYVEALRTAGVSVALLCRLGGREATETAQRFGARLYPASTTVSAMVADFGRVGRPCDYVLDLSGEATDTPARIALSLQAQDLRPDTLARHLLFLLYPDNAELRPFQSLFSFTTG